MRHGLHILMAIMSCCFLCFTIGCGTENASHDQGQANADSDVPTDGHNTLPIDQAPILPPPPVPVPVPVPIDSGHGSEGASRKADTGNPDNDPEIVPETDCADGEDNDGDGLEDCEDPNCFQKTCDDDDPCTVDEVCVEAGPGTLRCAGTPSSACNDNNECTMDVCLTVPNTDPATFTCTNMLDLTKDGYSSCTPSTPDQNCAVARLPDGSCPPVPAADCEKPLVNGVCPDRQVVDACIVGRCIETQATTNGPVSFTCEAGQKELIPENDGGCIPDEGPACRSVSCDEEDGECEVEFITSGPCNDSNACSTGEQCNASGVCTGGTPSADTVACEDGNPCTTAGTFCDGATTVCPAGAGVEAGTACDTDLTTECSQGQCSGPNGTPPNVCDQTPPPPLTFVDEICPDDNECTECECVDTGADAGNCKCTVTLGPTEEVCELDLFELVSDAIDTQLESLGYVEGDGLACLIGLNTCIANQTTDCQLNLGAFGTCDAATLNSVCDGGDFFGTDGDSAGDEFPITTAVCNALFPPVGP